MATALAPSGPEIRIPAPLSHQTPVVESAARFKVVRAGRRGGKTVLAESCAVVGHGPTLETGDPLYKGIVHNLDVVWVARDYTQAGIMWHEFIRPRFKGVPGVKVNEADRTVAIVGAGTLFVISAENIASARGMGQRLAGVIVEEAAWLDLQSALRDVLLPALMDNEGWLLLISTTNAGTDGGKDDAGQPRTPSYFNTICQEIRAGQRSDEWQEFHFTAEHNPKITRRAFDALASEYTAGTPSLEQEVYAKLLTAGVGLALPELSAAVHLIPRFTVPDDWRQFGAFDWGFNHPWVFGWYAVDNDGIVVKIDTLWGRGDLPEQIGQTISAAVPVHRLGVVYAGHDIFGKKGFAIGYKGPTIEEQLHPFGLTKMIRANVDRVSGLDNFRRFIHWEADEMGAVTRKPMFRLMDTDGNRRLLAQLQAMQVDPKNLEDALGVDANHAGKGGDDGYDETRYGLMSRWREMQSATTVIVSDDKAEPFDYRKRQFVPYPHAADTLDVFNGGSRGRPHVRAPRPRIGRP